MNENVKESYKTIAYTILILYLLVRPLTLMLSNVRLHGFTILDVTGIGFSYIFLLFAILNLKEIKLNRTTILILLFCSFTTVSFCWGSPVKEIAKLILPFMLLFSVQLFVNNTKQYDILSAVSFVSFFLPIIISAYLIYFDVSIAMVEYRSKIERHSGPFAGVHTLAYVMLYFSFFSCLFYIKVRPAKTYIRWGGYIFQLLSMYCLYQTYTRTAFIGFIIFWSIFLFGLNKKLILLFSILLIFISIIFQSHFSTIFWKTSDDQNLNRATSGRLGLWTENYKLYLDYSLAEKIIGRGLTITPKIPYHNDYLAMLMNLGIVGLSMYLLLLGSLYFDILQINNEIYKYFFASILISTAIMNSGSNAIISRFELSQYFWLLMGLIYLKYDENIFSESYIK